MSLIHKLKNSYYKRNLRSFIARIGLKYCFSPLVLYGVLNYVINAKHFFKPFKDIITNLFNPSWILVFSTLIIRISKVKMGKCFLCTSLLNRVKFVVSDWSSLYIYFHIWLANDYEKIVKPKGKVIVDVGAHIGLFTLKAIKTYKSNLVIAVEPNPENLNLLYVNILLNGVKDKVRIIKACAGKSKGRRKLFITEESGRSSVLPLSSDWIVVNEVKLDEELNDVEIDFVKIDVEGAELDVLDGLRKKLEKNRPILVIETNKQNITSLLSYFKELNYQIRIIPYGKENFHVTALPY